MAPGSVIRSSAYERWEQVWGKLTALVADPEIKVTITGKRSEVVSTAPADAPDHAIVPHGTRFWNLSQRNWPA